MRFRTLVLCALLAALWFLRPSFLRDLRSRPRD